MADNDVATELAAMREQLQRLERERTHQQSATPAAPAPAVGEPILTAAEEVSLESDWLAELENLDLEEVLERLKSGASEWLQELDSELKDVKPSTLLMVFGAGVLVGKLTK
jgi:hypothetical protein